MRIQNTMQYPHAARGIDEIFGQNIFHCRRMSSIIVKAKKVMERYTAYSNTTCGVDTLVQVH